MQLGPISGDELKGKAGSGEILGTDLVWKEGMPDWKPLGEVGELQVRGAFVPQQMGSVPMPQPTAYPADYARQIPSHLVPSIIATVIGGLMCTLVAMPMGIVAIVFASKVESLQARGDIAGAGSASKTAKTWMICSFVCSAGLVAVFVVAMLFGLFSGM
jgi:hypothetical protein